MKKTEENKVKQPNEQKKEITNESKVVKTKFKKKK